MAGLVADRGVDCCLMHMLGEPRTMQRDPRYDDVVSEVKAFLEARHGRGGGRRRAPRSASSSTPGSASARRVEHNLELLRRLDELVDARAARSSSARAARAFLGRLTGRDVTERVHGTIATCVLALERGARVFRVHDVAAVADALAVAAATLARSMARRDDPEDYDDDDLTTTTTTTTRAPRSGSPSRSSGCRSTRTTA